MSNSHILQKTSHEDEVPDSEWQTEKQQAFNRQTNRKLILRTRPLQEERLFIGPVDLQRKTDFSQQSLPDT